MSIGSVFKKIEKWFSGNMTAIEKFVSEVSPVVADDLAAFMATLPDAFQSLETAAEKAIALIHDAKGVTVSKSLAIAVAQNVFNAKEAAIVAEAEKALTAL